MKRAVAGCPTSPTVIAAGQSTPSGIAVDSVKVYWTQAGGVMKAPK